MAEGSRIPFREMSVIVTSHALKRFMERWPYRNRPKNPLQTIQKSLASAKESKLPSRVKVERIFNHNFQWAEYFENAGLRYVIEHAQGDRVLVTVESTRRKK